MNAQPLPAQPAGLSIGDIYYVLFRHKWKILLCTTLAVLTAYMIVRRDPPPYQSEAKLYVRYVVGEKAIGPVSNATAKSPDQRGETIMNSETEILTSVDLLRQVAEAIGPEKILARMGGGKDITVAMAVLKQNLTVSVPTTTTVMLVRFKHPDPELVQAILREIIERYLKLHVEAHTANGMLGDFLTQETDQLRAKLLKTEDELRKATNRAGVISIDDAKTSYGHQVAIIRQELFSTEAELAQRTSALDEISKRLPVNSNAPKASADAPVPAEILSEYRSVSVQADLLRKMEQELLTQFTPESPRVADVHSQLVGVDANLQKLQERYPRLLQIGIVEEHGPSTEAVSAAGLATQITALQAKRSVLLAQLESIRGETAKIDQMEGTIVELRRRKELEEANYRNYSATLEQARIDETLGNGRVSNIIQIQRPSPPFSDNSKTNKTLGMIIGGGALAGFAWAFFIELYFDRSIRRAVDIERTLPIPLLLSIPAVRQKLLLKAGSGVANGSALDSRSSDPLIPFHETLRDRLIGYFESINLNHKPKLVAVTGLATNAGVTTTAAGLARTLSETGEGNVLLVDMNVGHGMAQQFNHGKPCGIDDLLESRESAKAEENLYVVVENSQSDRLSRNMPQRFTKLVPKLKASDFDYIIFDMPPISQISITPRLASFMDMVLLVIESEKTDRDLVKRATGLLGESAHVGIVLNKTHNYVPAKLYQESLPN